MVVHDSLRQRETRAYPITFREFYEKMNSTESQGLASESTL